MLHGRTRLSWKRYWAIVKAEITSSHGDKGCLHNGFWAETQTNHTIAMWPCNGKNPTVQGSVKSPWPLNALCHVCWDHNNQDNSTASPRSQIYCPRLIQSHNRDLRGSASWPVSLLLPLHSKSVSHIAAWVIICKPTSDYLLHNTFQWLPIMLGVKFKSSPWPIRPLRFGSGKFSHSCFDHSTAATCFSCCSPNKPSLLLPDEPLHIFPPLPGMLFPRNHMISFPPFGYLRSHFLREAVLTCPI